MIYNRTEKSLELKIIPEFNSQWKLAQENLENGNQEEFIQVIDKITEMLCETLGFDKLQDTPEQRGNIFAYLIDAPELRTKILSPFPFVYLREHTTSDDDFKSCLSSIVDAMKVNHSFAVLTVFDNASLLRLKVKKLLYTQYDFIVIDKNNFRGVLMAKDPQNVFVQTINMWWTTMFFEQSGCDVKVVDDKCIIEKTPGENLQEYGKIYIHYSTSHNDIEEFHDFLQKEYKNSDGLKNKLAFVILGSTELSSGIYHILSSYRLNEGLITLTMLDFRLKLGSTSILTNN